MTVYVVTKSAFLDPEVYVAVRATPEKAFECVYKKYPKAEKLCYDLMPHTATFLCERSTTESHGVIMHVHMEELE